MLFLTTDWGLRYLISGDFIHPFQVFIFVIIIEESGVRNSDLFGLIFFV